MQRVIAAVSEQTIRAIATRAGVIATPKAPDVVPGAKGDQVIANPRIHPVVISPAEDDFIAVMAKDTIRPRAAVEGGIGAAEHADQIVALQPGKGQCAGGSEQQIAVGRSNRSLDRHQAVDPVGAKAVPPVQAHPHAAIGVNVTGRVDPAAAVDLIPALAADEGIVLRVAAEPVIARGADEALHTGDAVPIPERVDKGAAHKVDIDGASASFPAVIECVEACASIDTIGPGAGDDHVVPVFGVDDILPAGSRDVELLETGEVERT